MWSEGTSTCVKFHHQKGFSGNWFSLRCEREWHGGSDSAWWKLR